MKDKIRIAVLGAGGLGKAAAKIISLKNECVLTVMCDSHGYIADDAGLNAQAITQIKGSDLVEGYQRAVESQSAETQSNVATCIEAKHCADSIQAVIDRADAYDAVLIALPNLPNKFIPDVIQKFAEQKPGLVYVDVLKRTRAVQILLDKDEAIKNTQSVVLTGCGATPGILATAAVLAAQSFIKVEKVDIWWGVGIANWEAYKATIREDIAHMPGYDVEKARAMSDADVDALLEETNGILELRGMEHADDVLLEKVGVVDSLDQVEVGGIMDTRHAKKPVSTTMTLTGITHDGQRSSHKFVLGDETTMAANVIGPALGFMKRALWLKDKGLFGVFGSTEFLPMIMR